jgi:pilus assembly protein CpaB
MIIASCALLLSACIGYLVYRAVGARVASTKPIHTTEVVVAARDLAVGTLIGNADLKLSERLGSSPPGAVLKREALLNRGVASAIYEGEPVTENRLFPKGSGGGLAAMIPEGMRACAVRVNEVVGVAGFVVPGMRVDVLIAGLPPGGSSADGARVRTLLQNIEVLSAGTNFKKDQEGKPEQAQVVNLLVTPPQAEILSLASNETRIQLVLRNPMDTQITKTPGTAMSDLFRTDHPAELAAIPVSRPHIRQSPLTTPAAPAVLLPVAPRLYVIEVTNGSVRTQATFNRPAGRE